MSATSGSSEISQGVAISSSGNKADYSLASSMKLDKNVAQYAPSGNAYLDSLPMKTFEMNNYENFSQAKSFNTQKFLANQNQSNHMNETVNMMKAMPAAAQIKEEVSFVIEKMEDKPVVISNHFAGDVTQSTQQSIVTKSVANMWGQLLMNFYLKFRAIDTDKIRGPAFGMVFAALCFVVPTPAFAATAAKLTIDGATVVAQSNMTKLLKSVFLAGAAAVITVSFIHPIDVVKTRMQVAPKGQGSLGDIVGSAMKNEGFGAFYKGIGPAWLREASYTSLRLGLYEPIKILVGATAAAGFFRMFLAGALAGAIGSFAGNPFDVLKTRMMSDKTSNKSLGETASEIMKVEGISGFYKGFNVNVMRAMVLNATKMACYDTCKAYIVTMFAVEGLLLQFLAAFVAGFVMTCTVAPFDMCRTLLMNQKKGEDGVLPYKNLGDCFMQILNKDGPAGFYKGFLPIWTRFAPTTCLQLIIFDSLKRIPYFAM